MKWNLQPGFPLTHVRSSRGRSSPVTAPRSPAVCTTRESAQHQSNRGWSTATQKRHQPGRGCMLERASRTGREGVGSGGVGVLPAQPPDAPVAPGVQAHGAGSRRAAGSSCTGRTGGGGEGGAARTAGHTDGDRADRRTPCPAHAALLFRGPPRRMCAVQKPRSARPEGGLKSASRSLFFASHPCKLGMNGRRPPGAAAATARQGCSRTGMRPSETHRSPARHNKLAGKQGRPGQAAAAAPARRAPHSRSETQPSEASPNASPSPSRPSSSTTPTMSAGTTGRRKAGTMPLAASASPISATVSSGLT